MNASIFKLYNLVILTLFTASAAVGQIPSLDDFLAPAGDDPAKGIEAPSELQEPGAVNLTKERLTGDGKETTVVEAANAQDAIISAVENNIKFRKAITVIKVGSGKGVVASGTASYENHENRNAALISKRLAYTKAFMAAKKNLAEYIHGLSVDAAQGLVESIDAYDTSNESLANSDSVFAENNEQKLEGMIRGYVIYSVNDDIDKREVTVNIVSTPKTRGETLRASSGAIFAVDFEAGMKQVFAELKSGVLPPSGARVISITSGDENELFFVSFGSSINRINKNTTLERKLHAQAAEVARQRAAANLVALIIGEDAAWMGGFSEGIEESQKQFSEELAEDPDRESSITSLDETMSSFKSRMTSQDAYRFAQNGKLPPGLQAIQWESEDGDWSYAAYVYNPSLTLEAENVRDAMSRGPGILDRGSSLNRTKTSAAGDSGASQPKSTTVDREEFGQDRPVGQGASGQAAEDSDL